MGIGDNAILSGLKFSFENKSIDELRDLLKKINTCKYPEETQSVIKQILWERGESIEDIEWQGVESQTSINKARPKKKTNVLSSIGVLRVFAWLELVASILIGIWIIFHATTTFLPESVNHTQIFPIGIPIGIAVILQGIIVCSLLLVISSIAENIIAIRLSVLKKGYGSKM